LDDEYLMENIMTGGEEDEKREGMKENIKKLSQL
jgi:hypothetical protein